MKITKAVILAAGLGTRFLPVTKGVPKEMLAIIDKPAIQYVVEEAAESGITDILLIINEGKEAVEKYFGANPVYDKLTNRVLLKDLDDLLAKVSITFAYQKQLNGTGGALMLAREFTKDEPFAVLFGDDIIVNRGRPCTRQLIDAYHKTGKMILGAQERSAAEAVNYGVIEKGETDGRYIEIKSIVEKPSADKLPSTLCSFGRYILTPDIYGALEKTALVGNELFLPYGIDYLIENHGAYAYDFIGRRYDLGSKFGFLQANIETGLECFGDDLRSYLFSLLKN